MRIEAQEYVIFLDEKELLELVFALRTVLYEGVDHAKKYTGRSTFESNCKGKVQMFQTMCSHLGRINYYEEVMAEIYQSLDS